MDPITLPSGATITLRTAGEITERHRRTARLAMMGLSEAARTAMTAAADDDDARKERFAQVATRDDVSIMFEVSDHVAAAVIKEWSYPAAITADAIVDLPQADYDAVLQHTAPLAPVVFGTSVNFDPNPDPQGPT